MSDVSVNYVFTDAAAQAVAAERNSTESVSVPSMALFTLPGPGDLISDERLSRHVFRVVNRLFKTGVDGITHLQILLDIVPQAPQAPVLRQVP